MRDKEMKPIAVLRREIGEDTWFDWTPVLPGSKTHLALKESGEMDYCEVYTRPALTDEQVRGIAEKWALELSGLSPYLQAYTQVISSAICEAIGRGERG